MFPYVDKGKVPWANLLLRFQHGLLHVRCEVHVRPIHHLSTRIRCIGSPRTAHCKQIVRKCTQHAKTYVPDSLSLSSPTKDSLRSRPHSCTFPIPHTSEWAQKPMLAMGTYTFITNNEKKISHYCSTFLEEKKKLGSFHICYPPLVNHM